MGDVAQSWLSDLNRGCALNFGLFEWNVSLLVVWDAKCKIPISWRMKSLFTLLFFPLSCSFCSNWLFNRLGYLLNYRYIPFFQGFWLIIFVTVWPAGDITKVIYLASYISQVFLLLLLTKSNWRFVCIIDLINNSSISTSWLTDESGFCFVGDS